MEWYHIFGIVLGNLTWILPIFFWVRAESRADWRKADEENKVLRRDMIDIMRSIDQEMKDFHGRLCSIEENRKR